MSSEMRTASIDRTDCIDRADRVSLTGGGMR